MYQSNYMLLDLERYIVSCLYIDVQSNTCSVMTNGRSICQKEKNCLRTVIIKTQIIVKQQKYTIKTFLLHTCIRTKIESVPESAHCFSYGFMITRRRSFFFSSRMSMPFASWTQSNIGICGIAPLESDSWFIIDFEWL